MEPDDLQRIKTELLDLIRQQTESLENMTFDSATEVELRGYHERRERVYQLGEELIQAAREAKADTAA